MSTSRFAVLALVAACSSKKSAAPPAVPCLPGEISSTGTGIAAVDGITARTCWGTSCLTLDRDGKAIGPADYDTTSILSLAARGGLFARVRTTTNTVSVCGFTTHASCVEMPVPATWAGPSVSPLLVASASHKRLTAFLVDSMETWEPKTATKVSTFPTTGKITEARYVGDARVLSRTADGGGWMLHDTLSGQVMPVGEPGWDLAVIDGKSAVVFHGTNLLVVNAAGMTAGPSFTLPGHVAMATAWFDRILVVLDHPAGTAQIDPATGTLYSGPALPICK